MKNADIVYFLKDSAYNDELRYSLRSIEKNLPHGKVFFYGGRPIGLKPDEHILVNQKPNNKWGNVSDMLYEACKNEEISENFWLMNDDFFVLYEPQADIYSDSTIQDLIGKTISKNRLPSKYAKHLEKTIAALEEKGYPTMNFEVHCPMLINRKAMLEVYETFPEVAGHRSLYGNMMIKRTGVAYATTTDNKIVDLESGIGDGWFVSTDDRSFSDGNVGKEIRVLFEDKCRYER